jgi:hypothetical protein
MSYRLLKIGVLRLADSLRITRDMREWQDYRAWVAQGNTPEPMTTPPATLPSLPDVKRRRIKQLTDEALELTADVLPEFGNLSALILMRELYLSIAPAARQPTAKLTQVIDIYQDWDTAVAAVRACATRECVAAVAPLIPPPQP